MLTWSFNWQKLQEIAQPNKISIANPVLASCLTEYREDENAGVVETERKVSPTSGEEEHVAPASQEASPESIEKEVRLVFGEEAENALKVMKCESQGDPARIGDKHLPKPSYGLFQVNVYYNPKYDPQRLLEAKYNIQAAHEIFNEGGWKRWTCAKVL